MKTFDVLVKYNREHTHVVTVRAQDEGDAMRRAVDRVLRDKSVSMIDVTICTWGPGETPVIDLPGKFPWNRGKP